MRSKPLLIAVAPNGAYKTQADHPAIPLRADALADEAEACLQAGARMLHLHVREEDGAHSLRADLYRQALKAVRQRVGDELLLQVTTEAAGVYRPDQQRRLLLNLRPQAASIALREMLATPQQALMTLPVLERLVNETACSLQIIVYSAEELTRWYAYQQQGLVPDWNFPLLFVLGRYHDNAGGSAQTLQTFLDVAADDCRWMCCAFGEHEFECLKSAVETGGDVRVGFENHLFLKSGEVAASNAELCEQMQLQASLEGIEMCTYRDCLDRLSVKQG